MRAYDVVFEKLLVKPECETVYQNSANLVMLNASRTSYNRTFNINLPQIFVPDSERISVSVIGDMLGAAITNIDDLLREPYGCGEQNMVNFVPNIVALNYLTKTKKLTKKYSQKAIANMQSGYKRELTYCHNDGSFSAFVVSDRNGST
ncbi:hypothetical protein B4U79_09355 [Dinothrombium tinctorium]|uniref:Alpha-macroglobulin-like TED domain-containing protein n=1 Tax=Dinothrombium tinctorium TaxID=1965070 RepID=A0A443QD16_9ACAR|nr:hypothetical protein B4U79_09355 [Dinothrombium tinctorium]